jgi:hypothetical protein
MAKSTTQSDLNELLILKKGYRKIELYVTCYDVHYQVMSTSIARKT